MTGGHYAVQFRYQWKTRITPISASFARYGALLVQFSLSAEDQGCRAGDWISILVTIPYPCHRKTCRNPHIGQQRSLFYRWVPITFTKSIGWEALYWWEARPGPEKLGGYSPTSVLPTPRLMSYARL